MIEEIKSAGFDTVELNFALSEAMVNDVLALKQRGGILVSSLHNICPLPSEIERDEASPDYYSLASPDPEERKLAVSAAKNTIRYARLFDAKAVIIHGGRVQIKDRTRSLAALAGDPEAFGRLREAMISERSAKKNGYLDNLIASLDELAPYARGLSVRIGIENRYYYREIPITEEFDTIFETFKNDTISYWHDVGHAEVFDRLGLVKHSELLERYSGRLIGMHLHDIMGNIDDHKPPGLGTFNFALLKEYLTKDLIKVIEIHKPASLNQIKKSVDYLSKIFGWP